MYYKETVQTSVIRLYDVPNGYEERKKYLGVLTVIYLTPKKVWIANLLAIVRITRADIKNVKDLLKSNGVSVLKYERDGEELEEVL